MSEQDRQEFTRWWLIVLPLAILTIIAIAGVTLGLNSCGRAAGSVVDRKVFENSHQYTEARKTEIATLEAQLDELDGQLADKSLSQSARARLSGQRKAVNRFLRVAREKQ